MPGWVLHTVDAHGHYGQLGFLPADETVMQRPPPVIARPDRTIRRWTADGGALVLAETGKADRELAHESGRNRAAIDSRCGLRRTRPDFLINP